MRDSGKSRCTEARPLREQDSPLFVRYVGKYKVVGEAQPTYTVSQRNGQLYCDFQYNGQPLELVPHSERAFSLRWTAGDVDFDVKPEGAVGGLTFTLGGDRRTASRVE